MRHCGTVLPRLGSGANSAPDMNNGTSTARTHTLVHTNAITSCAAIPEDSSNNGGSFATVFTHETMYAMVFCQGWVLVPKVERKLEHGHNALQTTAQGTVP
jgi:hypothetical protein